jgi:hypothetical protein
MLCKVTMHYTDRLSDEVHYIGEEVELTDSRAAELSEGGYVEMPAEAAQKPAKAAPKRTRKTSPKAGKEGA